MSPNQSQQSEQTGTKQHVPPLQVVIEIPRGSFLKRGSTGRLDFISPLPCPFNYGSVPAYLGLDGDLLDAVVLGPRLKRGTRIGIRPIGAVGMTDCGIYEDKLICAHRSITEQRRSWILLFFRFYAGCKGVLNLFRGRRGRTACEGWRDAGTAIAQARPRSNEEPWKGPDVSL